MTVLSTLMEAIMPNGRAPLRRRPTDLPPPPPGHIIRPQTTPLYELGSTQVVHIPSRVPPLTLPLTPADDIVEVEPRPRQSPWFDPSSRGMSEREFYNEIQGEFVTPSPQSPLSRRPRQSDLPRSPRGDRYAPTQEDCYRDTSYWVIMRHDGLYCDLGMDKNIRWVSELPTWLQFPTMRATRFAIENLCQSDPNEYAMVRITHRHFVVAGMLTPTEQDNPRARSNRFHVGDICYLCSFDARGNTWATAPLASHDAERLEFHNQESARAVRDACRSRGHLVLIHGEDGDDEGDIVTLVPQALLLSVKPTNDVHMTAYPYASNPFFAEDCLTEQSQLKVFSRVVELDN
jgi:hypothetical protein